MTSPYLTVAEVASILRCHEKTVRRRLNRGDIRGTWDGSRWLVHERDVPGALPPRRRPTSAPRRHPHEEGVAAQAVRDLEAS